MDFALGTLGIANRCFTDHDSDTADIVYGNNPERPCAIRIPFIESDILWPALLEGRITPRDVGPALPFDLISAIGAFLTDRVNRDAPPEAFDQHDRLIYEGSFQASSGFGHVPIVNRYLNFFAEIVEHHLGVHRRPLWPDGKRCAIALTHDVDAPIKHGASGGPWLDPRASLKRNFLTNAYRAKWSIERLLGSDGLDHWHFPLIMEAESVRGFNSTFLFAVTRRFDPAGHSDFDVSYDVGSSRFGELFKQLSYRDFEVGLHAGYNSHLSAERFEDERLKLERLANVRVRGLRHHAWHLGRDVTATLEAHEEAEFQFDSSLAFNRRAKLRRSVALPYRPWSERLGRAVDVIQIPVALMDGHIFYHDVSEDDALRQACEAVDGIKDVGGVGAIDWHVRTSSPDSKQFGTWGRTYVALLDYLSEQDDIWITSLGEINDWIRARERRLLIPDS